MFSYAFIKMVGMMFSLFIYKSFHMIIFLYNKILNTYFYLKNNIFKISKFINPVKTPENMC